MIDARTGVPVEVDLGPAEPGGLHEVMIVGPEQRTFPVPAFQTADGHVRFRFAAPAVGRYTFESPAGVAGADTLAIEARPYAGDNPLYRHGRPRVASDGRTLEHADGTPFLWLGDTWWMGLGQRLDWPQGFRTLLDDRVEKGFSVIQIVAGPLPDFAATPEGIWHPDQANDGGWPWDRDWARLNPAFFDDADRRIEAIVEAGLVPCIVGMWAYYEHVMGPERIRRHWRELVARWAAYPVVFCVAGEVNLAGYDFDTGREERDARRTSQLATWTEVAHEVHRLDTFGSIVTAHPASPDGRSLLDDPEAVDVNMVQTSHWSYHLPEEAWRRDLARDLGLDEPLRMGFHGTLSIVAEAIAQDPPMPVINAEPCYEGILGGNWQDVQRFNFWTGWLSGLGGYTYGADGIWQMSLAGDASEQRVSQWGNGSWQAAMHYEGGRQVAAGAGLLRQLPWWTLRPVDDARAQAAGRVRAFGARGQGVTLHYLPSRIVEERLRGMRDLPVEVPAGGGQAKYVDPATMVVQELGRVEPGPDGTWQPPQLPTYADWLLLVES